MKHLNVNVVIINIASEPSFSGLFFVAVVVSSGTADSEDSPRMHPHVQGRQHHPIQVGR